MGSQSDLHACKSRRFDPAKSCGTPHHTEERSNASTAGDGDGRCKEVNLNSHLSEGTADLQVGNTWRNATGGDTRSPMEAPWPRFRKHPATALQGQAGHSQDQEGHS